MERLLKVKYVSLPNLIVGNAVVPELLVHRAAPPTPSRANCRRCCSLPRRDWQIQGYRNMQRRLGTSVAADLRRRTDRRLPPKVTDRDNLSIQSLWIKICKD